MSMLIGLVAFALAQQGLSQGSATAIDGERLQMGAQVFLLWGVRAPATGRGCRFDDEIYDCGARATETLSMLVGERDVRCTSVDLAMPGDVVVARCDVGTIECYATTCSTRWRDLSEELVSEGVVVQRRDQTSGFYDEVERTARLGRAGVWNDPRGAGIADVESR